MGLMIGALTELCHYYGLPMLGTAGCSDSELVDAQAGIGNHLHGAALISN